MEILLILYNTEIHRALNIDGFSLSISLKLAFAVAISSALVGGPGCFTAEGAPLSPKIAAERPLPPPSEERKALGDLCTHGYYSSIT